MRQTTFLILLLVFGICIAIAQPIAEIRVVAEDQNSIILEFTPKIHAERVTGSQNSLFTQYSFFESQELYDANDRADYLRSVLLLFPSAKYSLRILESEFQVKDSVRLLPKPTVKFLKDFSIIETYDETELYKASFSSANNELAEIVWVGKTSREYIGKLIIRPIQQIARERVKIFTRIVVRIDFATPFNAGLVSSCLLRGNLPNNGQSVGLLKAGYKQTVGYNSPLAQGEWYRMEIRDVGMYKLDYNYFHGLNPAISDINSIRLFGNGGVAIPDNNAAPHPDSLVEISRLVIDNNNDGIFDTDDYIVFYGRGIHRWNYSGGNTFQHVIHPYSDRNFYFFTFNQGSGRQMDTISALEGPPPTYEPATFKEKIFVEEERYNLINSGRRWVGKLFSGNDITETYYNALWGIEPSLPITYKFQFLHRSSSIDTLNIYENGQLLYGPVWMSSTTINGNESSSYAANLSINATRASGTPISTSALHIRVGSRNQDAKTWLDWIEIFYQRKFEAGQGFLYFATQDIAASVQYSVSNISINTTRVFDVTDHSNVKQITQLEYDAVNTPTCKFKLQQTSGNVREITVAAIDGFKVPALAIKVDNTVNLHGMQSQYDFIIISPPEFIPEANRLKAHRELHDNLSTFVVDINHIYSEFSGGLPDPLAIREFLRYTRERWIDSKPRYVLLFGNGHYDYKNISTNQRNWIPPFETEQSLIPVYSYPSDDKFVEFSDSNVYAVAIGRLPARSTKDASVMVDKIISYETSSAIGTWRNKITLVADDGKTSQEDNGALFTANTEDMAKDSNYIPKFFDKNKIYIVQYPTVNSASGRRKPDANRMIIESINQGTLITNYIGHGNERLWAHEAIFTREDNLPQLVNRDRLTFIFAATCSYGLYDNPVQISAAELLVTMEEGGTIANASASRWVYNSPNVAFNRYFYSYLFRKDSLGIFPRIGDAWRLAKLGTNDKNNNEKFHLFGDPTIRLLLPQNTASVDSVDGNSTTGTVEMKSLGRVRVAGKLENADGTKMTSFYGKGTLQLFDSQKEIVIQDGIGTFRFKIYGSPLYRGQVSVDTGAYALTIPIPKDVTYGQNSRISFYAWNNQTDGVGYTENVIINGIDTTAAIDTLGPLVSVYLDNYAFQYGDMVKKNPKLIVRLEDESGINTSTVGVGHQLSATISNPERTIDLSNYYQSDLDTYKSGEAQYQLRDLADGQYRLKVKAWDTQNNSSETETFFEVYSANDFALMHVFNYPNPFTNSTTFSFQRNIEEPIDVEVKVYSVAGRLIRNMKVQVNSKSVRVPWDGKDNDGNDIANGVYFYKVIARSQDGTHTNETIGKCVVLR